MSVPKSYHDAINRIQLFADSIQVEHEYTLVPLDKMKEEWWSEGLKDDVRIQWKVDQDRKEVAAVRMIYNDQKLDAVLCISLDYNKIFQPLTNILTQENGGIVADKNGTVLYNKTGLTNLEFDKSEKMDSMIQKISQSCAYTKTKSEENDWVFYLYKSQDAISGSVRRLLLEEIPLIAACGLIILFLAMAFSRIFTRKIEELTKNMDRVNHGSREVTVSSDSEDEVGILINSFHNMMDEINRLIDEVYVNKIALKEYELKALQAQINPHFLYNTLSLINWKAIEADAEDISKITLALSTFYRTSLNKGKNVMSLSDELRNMRSYLDIQLMMHDYEFDVEFDVDESIGQYQSLNLMLQPLIENAIAHGIDVKTDGRGKLTITGKEDGDLIVLTVADNGVGMSDEQAARILTEESKGYGVRNVNERIKLYYGEQYSLQIESKIGQGTKASIRISKEDIVISEKNNMNHNIFDIYGITKISYNNDIRISEWKQKTGRILYYEI